MSDLLTRNRYSDTLAMADRRDAVAAFARMAATMHREVGGADADVRFTTGRVKVEPNAPSFVPTWVRFRIDLRHPESPVLDRSGARLSPLA